MPSPPFGLAAGDYRGGVFLNAVLIAKGLLLLCEQVNNEPDMGDAAWGQLLSVELRGFFGVEYRERVPAAIEGFNRQLRKVTKAKSVFPADNSLLKTLHLAMMDITRKWTGRRQDWSTIHAQLAVYFADRMPD